MAEDPLKTRLEIAKSKFLNKNKSEKDGKTSPIGTAFKLSTELVSAVATADTSSVLNLNAVPMGDVFPSFSDLFLFKNFDFAISRRVLRGSSAILSKQPYFQLFVDQRQQVG